MSMSVWLSYTDEKIPHLKSSHVGKKKQKGLWSSLNYSSSESSSSLRRCDDEDFRGTESNPSDVLCKHKGSENTVNARPALSRVCLREERRHWPLESTTWSWRRRVSWWSTWCRPLHPLPPLLRSCPQSAARTLCSRSYRPAWSIYTAACGNRGQDGRLVNSNKVSSFLLSGCRLQFWINFRPHNSKKDLKTHLRVFFQK